MDILIGSLTTVIFFCCLAIAYQLGRKHNKTETAQQLTEQEAKEEELKLKGWQNVLDYDVDVAIGRRVNK